MSLNISTGNMYDFITHTWNTVKGRCPHDCSYCYMKKWGNQKPVRFDEKELKTDLGKDNFIFVGSSCDMFANFIPSDWIVKTLNHCNKFNNQYLFQTKNPIKLYNFNLFPDRSIFCTTIETNREYRNVMRVAPSIESRANAMIFISTQFKTFVTIEPIMDFDLKEMVKLIKLCNPEQVSLGADSGRNNLPEPSKEKILELISELQKFTVIHSKKNLARLLK